MANKHKIVFKQTYVNGILYYAILVNDKAIAGNGKTKNIFTTKLAETLNNAVDFTINADNELTYKISFE